MMDITVKSLEGSYLVSGVEDGTTVAELKRMLHQQHAEAPEPDKQVMVYRHGLLTSADAALQQLGIGHGDQLVMLTSHPPIKRQRAQTTPPADTAAIRAAITEEARRRGIEHTLKEERPPVARRGPLRLPAELLSASNDELMQLLQQALEGRTAGGLQLSFATGGTGGQEGAQEQEGELQVPEPPADRIAQLTDMGFSEALARNALLLHRGSVERGLEWALEHAEDPAAAEPLSQERLRQVYGRRQGRTGVRVSIGGLNPEALLSSLTDMGFDAQAAQAALSQVGPSLDLAVQMLLGGPPGRPRAGSAAGASAAASGAGAAGVSAVAAGAGAESAGGSEPAGTQAQPSSQEGMAAQPEPAPAAAAAAAAGAADSTTAAGEAQQPAERAGTPSGRGLAAEASEAATSAASERWHSQFEGDADELEDEEEEVDEDDEYDEDEDEEFFDNEEDALYDLPLGGTVQLANLGSADIESLLQGANLQELTMGNQLLMPGGMDAVLSGPQSTLLRLLDSPAFLEQVAAGMQAVQDTQEEQQQQQEEQPQQQEPGQQAQQPSQQQQQPQSDGAS